MGEMCNFQSYKGCSVSLSGGSDLGWRCSLHPSSITFYGNPLRGKSKAIRKNLPKSLGGPGGEQIL